MDVLWLHRFTSWYAAWSVVWCTSALLHSVSSGSIADVVPFKQAGGSIVPTAETALSPACPLRMWDWTYVTVKKKEQPAQRTSIIPNRPKRTIEHLLTSPCFPRSLTDPFPQWCPDLRRWAIVRPVLWLLPGGCTHTPQYSLALATCLSIPISVGDPAPWSNCLGSLEQIGPLRW